MSESMIERFMLALLWVSQSNTGPSSFWLLLYLIKDPVALEALRKEADKVLKDSGQEVRPGGRPVDLTYEMLMKTPVLDSAVEETLRLVAAPLLTRSVLQDMTLNMADGRQFFIRKGDRMAVFPYIAVHIDPEIHPDPHTFKYDRFLTPEGTRKTDFYKGGKRVKYYTMPWGSGVSMCPGRFFAINELKQFIFLMLVYFDFELINPDEKIPQIDYRRWGFGTMQPDREVNGGREVYKTEKEKKFIKRRKREREKEKTKESKDRKKGRGKERKGKERGEQVREQERGTGRERRERR
ncbi:hypothetical protein WMY93_000220 [Mugilogobius chulae]|uniref:Cytochrome P450 n=1 Tax=Mugilogobius chulae TaxID=88201 RepID=A0AAW0Q1K9_9GOBI